MLTLLPQESLMKNFWQELVVDPIKVKRLFNKSIRKMSWSRSPSGACELILYKRHNAVGRQEAGIIYVPGPRCGNIDFPMEMLRLFSENPYDCDGLAEKYYWDLVRKKKFA